MMSALSVKRRMNGLPKKKQIRTVMIMWMKVSTRPVVATPLASSCLLSPNLLATSVDIPTAEPMAMENPIMTIGVTTPIANRQSWEYLDMYMVSTTLYRACISMLKTAGRPMDNNNLAIGQLAILSDFVLMVKGYHNKTLIVSI